jgi:hypothetical protein
MRALAIVVLAGCFDPKFAAHLKCASPDNWCPPPQTCGANGFCGGGSGGDDAGPDGGLPEVNLVFTTSEPMTFGGLTNAAIVTMADAKCQMLGTKLRPGTYIAYLSTDPGISNARLPTIGSWARPDGRVFTTSVNNLGAQNEIFYPSRLDDDRADVVGLRMETAVATRLPASDGCTGGNNNVVIGSADGDTVSWRGITETRTCQTDLYVYCFETDRTASALPPVLDPGLLYAFVTNGVYAINHGIDELDADCRNAATAAGLTRNFRAFVAPTGASANSRFKGSTKPWTRLDGVIVAQPDLMELVAPIAIDETMARSHGNVAFGANSPSTPGSDATNCMSWGSGMGTSAGLSTRSSDKAFSGSAITCSSAQLYCLEIP